MACSGYHGPIGLSRGRLILSIIVWVAIIVSFFLGVNPLASQEASSETIIRYTNPDSVEIQMVFKPSSGRVVLRVNISHIGNNEKLEVLKDEVMRFVQADFSVQLGESGYTFRFNGRYPIWAPTRLSARNGYYQCLFFAENASIFGRSVVGWGRPDKIGFYPYPIG